MEIKRIKSVGDLFLERDATNFQLFGVFMAWKQYLRYFVTIEDNLFKRRNVPSH